MLDIGRILGGEINEITFEETHPVGDISNDIKSGAYTVKGACVNHSGYIEFHAVVSFEYEAVCARCGEIFKGITEIPISYPVTTKLENADRDQDEYLIPEGGKLDLGDICESGIILNLPSRFLCAEDCRGLCPECGTNLNTGACSCGGRRVDPRLEKLGEFYNK